MDDDHILRNKDTIMPAYNPFAPRNPAAMTVRAIETRIEENWRVFDAAEQGVGNLIEWPETTVLRKGERKQEEVL